MNELTIFYKKLADCDYIALTPINKGRFYCRFYADGLYQDRMFITDIPLQEELILLSDNDEIIDAENVSRLKDKYASLSKATGEEGALESAGAD